jgi:meso-butanediol dehydrogenase / (S,S)-butanediol dehydrogenase / diacetyl reductase
MSKPLAIVTGGASGIGAAIATTLADRGHYVVVADVDLEGATRVAVECGGEAVRLDVTDPKMVTEAVTSVVARHGRLDVMVANAGVSKMQGFLDVAPEDLRRTVEVNLYGVFYCGQAAARAMIELGTNGVIVNTASMAAKQGRVPFLSDYVASKFGVLGLTQAMAFELARHAIRVNCVCPGYVATPMQARELVWEAELRGMESDAVREMMLSDTPLGRLETSDDVARVVSFLVSSDAGFITGEAVSVNGGAFMD